MTKLNINPLLAETLNQNSNIYQSWSDVSVISNSPMEMLPYPPLSKASRGFSHSSVATLFVGKALSSAVMIWHVYCRVDFRLIYKFCFRSWDVLMAQWKLTYLKKWEQKY